jgi:hypothetical protein
MNLPRRATAFATLLILLALAALGAGPAAAAVGPEWRIESIANTTVQPGGVIVYHVVIHNVGDEPAPPTPGGDANNCVEGSPPPSDPDKCITLTGQFRPGVTPLKGDTHGGGPCKTAGSTITCQWPGNSEQISNVAGQAKRTILFTAKVPADGAGSIVTSEFQVEGGEAANIATTVDPTRISVTPPPFGIDQFEALLTANSGGGLTSTAGGHPFEQTSAINFNTLTSPLPAAGELYPVESTRDVVVDLPPGLVGDATLPASCSVGDLVNGGLKPQPLCPSESQVGNVVIRLNSSGFGTRMGPMPLFNMEPPPGSAARFAFDFSGTVVSIDVVVRPDGSLQAVSRNVPELGAEGTTVTLWGNPADPIHERERACPGKESPVAVGIFCPSDDEPAPFLRNPTSCGEPLLTSVAVDSWEHPGVFAHASSRSHQLPGFPHDPSEWGPEQGLEGCAAEPFAPSFSAKPTTHSADSPSGLDVEVAMPQQGLKEVGAVSESDLRDAAVKLPAGMVINPAAAGGQGSCGSGEVGLRSGIGQTPIVFSGDPEGCPDDSKIGTVQIETPVLDHPLGGAVYLAAQGDNPFQSLLAMYLVVEDPATGIVLKLPGRIVTGEGGSLETVFDDNPQLPFSRLQVHLFGGSRAALRTPASCGTYRAAATLSPWSGNAPAQLQSSFDITNGPGGGPCPAGGFDPKLSAGTQNPLAGKTSPFVLRITRDDGSQELGGLKVTLPPGLSGYLKGIPYCADGALGAVSGELGSGRGQEASSACPAASQLGTVTVGAGAGPTPFFTHSGRAYLAGPYKGAPLSLAVVAPAVAGPFDLGSVVVRNALQVDPTTAQITAVSDPLPTILHGIPLDLRDVRVELSRDHFVLNPTSCDPMQVSSTIVSSQGASANPSVPFQAAGCDQLGFKPKLALRFAGSTTRSGNPGLHATLRMPEGGANIARTRVTLPKKILIDNAHINLPCTRVQFDAGACPKSSILGRARAFSPLLDKPLEGPVYFRSNGGERELPDIVADLRGQLHVVVVGFIDTKDERIRNTFATVPDAPISKFTLDLFGGKRGLLENGYNLCRRKPKASAQFDAHNNKSSDFGLPVKVKCGNGKKSKRGHRGARRHR